MRQAGALLIGIFVIAITGLKAQASEVIFPAKGHVPGDVACVGIFDPTLNKNSEVRIVGNQFAPRNAVPLVLISSPTKLEFQHYSLAFASGKFGPYNIRRVGVDSSQIRVFFAGAHDHVCFNNRCRALASIRDIKRHAAFLNLYGNRCNFSNDNLGTMGRIKLISPKLDLAVNQSALTNADASEDGGKGCQESRVENYRIVERSLPKGFGWFAMFLFGIVFSGTLIALRPWWRA